MLILTRRTNESLVIGDNITLTVLGIKGNQVRIGISAPKEIVVDRAEVHARKQAECRTPVPACAGPTRRTAPSA